MINIVDKFVKQLSGQMADKGIGLRLDETAKQQLIEEGFDDKMGARPLQRVINKRIKLPLSKKILFESVKNTNLTISFDKEKDEFKIGE
jgi:ATP-dependent Clp protease ATP-binding subunit ClpA